MKYLNTASKVLPAGLEYPNYYAADPGDGTLKRWLERDKFYLSCPDTLARESKEHITWKEALGDVEVDLEAGEGGVGHTLEAKEVDHLTFCCCEAAIVQPAAQPPNCVLAPLIPRPQYCKSILHACLVFGLSP